jgi:hypothetical protein
MHTCNRLFVALALLTVVACGKGYDALYLSVTGPGGALAPDHLTVRLLGGTLPAKEQAVDLAGQDISQSAFVVKIVLGDDASLNGQALVSVVGLRDGVPVAAYSGKLDLSQKKGLDVALVAFEADCDADHDGFKNCVEKPACCNAAEAADFGDCDDDAADLFPLAAREECRTCNDTDGDGWTDCAEKGHEPACDAGNVAIHPGAEEACDGLDNDCDGAADEGLAFKDWNGAMAALGQPCGIGKCAGGTVQCDQGRVVCSTAGEKGTAEVADNGVDDNCNGLTDEGSVAGDTDGDSFPDAVEAEACDFPNAMGHAEVHPGAPEPCCPPAQAEDPQAKLLCDLNCDGEVSECGADDADDDGFGADEDCDDLDVTVHPGAPDKCGDGVDQDCLGGDAECTDANDKDGDGYNTLYDCDDADVAIFPGAAELCNGLDDDCDGVVDDGNPEGLDVACGTDEGECVQGVKTCAHPEGAAASVVCLGEVTAADADECNGKDDDCDGATDNNLAIDESPCKLLGVCSGQPVPVCAAGVWECHYDAAPGYEAEEITCDLKDNDCDGATDEGLTGPALSDCKKLGVCGVGEESIAAACVEGQWQCDYSAVPGWQAEETWCDEQDNDCDGDVDEGLVFTDWDGGVVALGAECGTGVCAGGEVVCGADKNPTCSTLGAKASEACNDQDDECNGATDEGFTWQGLAKGEACDGTGECGAGSVVCAGPLMATCSTNPDSVGSQAVAERCNLKDDDCDGSVDDDLGTGAPDVPCTLEGVCTPANVLATCTDGQWACDYSGVTGWQEGPESLCDDLDNDCDGAVDEDLVYADPDGTQRALGQACEGIGECGAGTVVCGGDLVVTCSTNPNGGVAEDSQEECDGQDNDCDGSTDEDFTWTDPLSGEALAMGEACDGVGECGPGVVECLGTEAATCSTNPQGSASEATVEACNLKDDDCDGETDDALDVTSPGMTCRVVGQCSPANVGATCVNGAWECDYGAVTGYQAGAEASCDGLDNDCDGQADEDFTWADPVDHAVILKGAACGRGACAGGFVVCKADKSGLECDSLVNASGEICNAVDDDCDGSTDEGLEYTDPDSGLKLGKGVQCQGQGECGAGTVECGTDFVITCSTNPNGSAPGFQDEECNHLDDDCDGETDDGLTWGGLFLGSPCTGFGRCGVGVVECATDSTLTTCSTNPDGSEHQNTPEVCNGQDDDCNGLADDSLTVQDSPCHLTGVCNAQNVVAQCNGVAGWACDYSGVAGYHEGNEAGLCDGFDNDCDGTTDDEYPLAGQACDGPDPDQCALGTWLCTATHDGVECVGDVARLEACGGGDEDCDGVVDEEGAENCSVYYLDADGDGFGKAAEHRCLCAPDVANHFVVTDSQDCDDTRAAVHPGADEVCNGLDDDCDSQTDVADGGLIIPLCEKQAGVCAGTRKALALCMAGAWQACGTPEYLAVSADYEAGNELSCDGLDNDCDGASDEDFLYNQLNGQPVAGVGAACGVGVCSGGRTVCVPAQTGIDCPSEDNAVAEACNNQDDDCDGLSDAADQTLGLSNCEVQAGVCAGARHIAAQCVGGNWQACTDSTYAAHDAAYRAVEEGTTCDSKDENCNGVVDEYAGAWNVTNVDTASTVDSFTSIAQDVDGKLYVSYYNSASGKKDLMFATNASGAWVTSTVASTGDVGRYSTIGVDAAKTVHILYYDLSNVKLRHTWKASGDGSWSAEDVDTANNPGTYLSLKVGAANSLHVAYFAYSTADLRYAVKTGASWSIEDVDASGDDVGRFASLALGTNGKPRVAYYNNSPSTRGVRFATKGDAGWTKEVVTTLAQDIGKSLSLALGANDKPYIAALLYPGTGGKLVLNRKPADTWLMEEIDPAVTIGVLGTSLAIDPTGRLHVVYYQDDGGDLKYATGAPGKWVYSSVVTTDTTGRYPSMVLTPGYGLAASFVNSQRGYLQVVVRDCP